MEVAADSKALLGRALLASLGLHVLVALSVPAIAWTESAATPVETISFVHVTRIEVTPPRSRRPPPRALAPRKSLVPAVNFATHKELARLMPRRKASPLPAVTRDRSVAPAVAAIARAGEGNAAGNAAPQATATPMHRAVASVGNHADGGYLPFGAEQPDPVLDPGVLKQLAQLGVHVTLIVTVGEDGRTKSIAFQPPIDSQAQARIESLLADASWDPAVCGGGISCEGHATIKL